MPTTVLRAGAPVACAGLAGEVDGGRERQPDEHRAQGPGNGHGESPPQANALRGPLRNGTVPGCHREDTRGTGSLYRLDGDREVVGASRTAALVDPRPQVGGRPVVEAQ